MKAYPAQDPGEGYPLPDHVCCLRVLTFRHKTDVTRDVDPCRAAGDTGDKDILLFSLGQVLIGEGTGGADLDTGPAEATVGFCIPGALGGPHDHGAIPVHESQGVDPPEVSACTDTPKAADTEVVIPIEQRLAGVFREIPVFVLGEVLPDAHIACDLLELAVAEKGAAALVLGNVR